LLDLTGRRDGGLEGVKVGLSSLIGVGCVGKPRILEIPRVLALSAPEH